MLGDLTKLEAWWRKRQLGEKLMKDTQQAPTAATRRRAALNRRNTPTRFQKIGLLNPSPQ